MAEQRDRAIYAMCAVRSLTGLSDRQIRYYDLTGLVVPQRTPGGHRLYSQNNVDALMDIKSLLGEGLTVEQVRQSIARRTQTKKPASWVLGEPDIMTRRDAMSGRSSQNLTNTAFVERRLGELEPKR